ncbi:MAG: cation transporter [Haliea sp.]
MRHEHDHAPANFGKAFAIGITLNLAFVLVEAFYGWQAASLTLLADAAHNLSDVGGLLLAWAAFAAARLKPNPRHTYGWRRGSILASFANAHHPAGRHEITGLGGPSSVYKHPRRLMPQP